MKFRALLVALLTASLLLGACGGDDKGDDLESLSSDTAGDTSDDTADDTSDDTSDDTADDTSDDTAMDDLGDLGDLGDMGQLGDCMEFAMAYGTLFIGAMGGMFADEEALQDFESQIGDLEGSVPDELTDEFATVSEAWSEYTSQLEDTPMSEWGEIQSPLDTDEFQEADAAITDWLDENCS